MSAFIVLDFSLKFSKEVDPRVSGRSGRIPMVEHFSEVEGREVRGLSLEGEEEEEEEEEQEEEEEEEEEEVSNEDEEEEEEGREKDEQDEEEEERRKNSDALIFCRT